MKADVSPRSPRQDLPAIGKSPTGISGLDEVTHGGLPQGRPTLLCGSAGCGKTLFSMTFLYNGAVLFDEPGVFIAFEEQAEDLVKNVGSLSYDIQKLIAENKLAVDHIHIDRNEIEESGRIRPRGICSSGSASPSIRSAPSGWSSTRSRRCSAASNNEAVLRSELRRLFEWLKQKGVTAIITGRTWRRRADPLRPGGIRRRLRDPARQPGQRPARHPAAADRQVSRLGARHQRISVHSRRGRRHRDADHLERIGARCLAPSGSRAAFRISTTCWKARATSRAPACSCPAWRAAGNRPPRRISPIRSVPPAQRCIYFAMEESPHQIMRNMRSVGLNMHQWVDHGLLRFSARRPNLYGLETHLAAMHREVREFDPAAVVIDPLSALMNSGVTGDVHSMMLRLVDFLKSRGITALFTNLGGIQAETASTEMQISSLMDAWLLLYNRESNGEHNRQLYLLKSRGMAHSNQVREFVMSSDGIKLREAYIGEAGVLTGSARLAQEARDRSAALAHAREVERRTHELERKRRATTAQIEALRAQLATEEAEADRFLSESSAYDQQLADATCGHAGEP